jgi:hypothetical protein
MFRVVVLGVIHAHHYGDVLALGWGGDDHFFAASSDVTLGFFCLGEEAGRFDDEIHPEFFPRESCGAFLDGETLDFMSIHHEDIILRNRGGGFGAGDVEMEATLGGVVFHEVGKVVSRDEIVDGDHLKFRSEEALLAESPEN